jgi:acetate---CoA ligase (ADP-forming)
MLKTDLPEAAANRAALAQALFSPRTIALVGASADQAKLASRPQRVLRKHGYGGVIVPINPARSEILGERAYHALTAVPGAVDHAFVMVPAAAVPDVIADCCEARVKVATIFTAGFAETGGEGKRRQDAMVAMAKCAGVRLVGPNCLGIVNVSGGVTLSANAVLEQEALRRGGLSVVSQSGSMLGGIITRAQERGLGFSKLVSVGNECDVGVGELVHLLVDDPDTRAILLFLEAFRDAPVLGAAARRAFEAGKPVIALKLGRSTVGREIATTHTGAMAGADDVAEAFFRANGIIRVDIFEALFETAQLVLDRRPPKGRRVAVLTVSGGAAAMVIDRLGLAAIDVVPPTPQIIGNLAAKNIQITDATLTDLPMGRAEGGIYGSILEELTASDHCDAVIAVQGSTAAYSEASVRERVLAARRGDRPLAVFLGPRASEALRMLQDGGVAAFRTPEACADAVRAYCDWRAPQPPVSGELEQITALKRAVSAAGPGTLNERAAATLLSNMGVPFVPSQVMRSGREPVQLPFPVVAKILSSDIPHKTDAGGVALDITDASVLAARVDAMLARIHSERPDARIDGVLVQPMQRGLGEAIVGFRRDRDVGPVVMVGVGGMLAEVCAGYAVRLAPVSIDSALEMIASVPGLALVRGYRNRPAGDLASLSRVVHLMSLLALADDGIVLEAEINPLIVRSDGVVAVDALVRIAEH